MYHKNTSAAVLWAVVFCVANVGAQAFEDSKYPSLKGQWIRAVAPGTVDEPRFDPSKPPGRGQEPPLTPEYQAIFDANLRERQAGVPGTWPGPSCLPPGMPAQMTAYRPLEFIVLPNITYIRVDYVRETRRRIYTDGRAWPRRAKEGLEGYSMEKGVGVEKGGRYDVREVKTRHFKGPRNFDLSGIPLHEDNETVIKERLFLDKTDQNLLHDEITVFDHALTRPWTVIMDYRRSADLKPQWDEYMCVWESNTIRIGEETYLLDKDGFLRPARKDQAPPSLKYFPAQR